MTTRILLFLIPALGLAQAPTTRERLIGAWKLLSFEQRAPNGDVTHPVGRDPLGILMYDKTGRMAVQIMDRSRPAQATTAEGIQSTSPAYIAYFGTFTVNEAEGAVTHHVEGSLNFRPARELTRSVELSGDRLILRPPPVTVPGGQRTSTLTWERIK